MNAAVLIGGILGTMLVLGFIATWVIEDLLTALKVAGALIFLFGLAAAIALFWVWMAGAFA